MAKVVPAIYPETPTSISQINKEYIFTYIKQEHAAGNLSASAVAELSDAYDKAKKDCGQRYFLTFRKAFTDKIYPSLSKAKSGKYNLDNLFADILKK